MKERPILFSAPMIRALIDGRKTQTRRVVKTALIKDIPGTGQWDCPYGLAGDRLWVRETWGVRGWASDPSPIAGEHPEGLRLALAYRSDDSTHRSYYPDSENYARIRSLVKSYADETRWRPSIHMPRWASRLTLEIAHVKVERLLNISEKDAVAEGFSASWAGNSVITPRAAFLDYIESVNSKRSYDWKKNPFVWAIEFRRV